MFATYKKSVWIKFSVNNATIISANSITSIDGKVTADRVNQLEAGELSLDNNKGAYNYVNLHFTTCQYLPPELENVALY